MVNVGRQSMIRENWRVILVTLLAANLVFMALLQWQRLSIWRLEREYFARVQQPSTEKIDFLTRELSETKKTQTDYFDKLYKLSTEVNTRVNRVEKALEEVPANVRETREIRARIDSLRTAVEQLSTPKQ